MSLNHIVILGRITKDIESRATESGKHVANFTVAVDRDFQPGGTEKRTDFVDVVAFGGAAGFVERNFRKGQLIVVSGRLQSRKWQDRDGNNRLSWSVVAENMYFCGDKKHDGPVSVDPPPFEELQDDNEGDLPF